MSTSSRGPSFRILLRNLRLFLRHGRQWWYWTPAWQEAEREADADIAAGRVTQYNTMEEAMRDLDGR